MGPGQRLGATGGGVPGSWESAKTCLWGPAHVAGKADRFCSCTPGRFTGMVSSPCPPLFYSTQAPWTVPPSVRTHPRRHSGEARGSGQLRASPPVPHCRIKGRVEGHTTLKAGWNKSRICHVRAWGPRASHFIWSSLDFFFPPYNGDSNTSWRRLLGGVKQSTQSTSGSAVHITGAP